MRASLFFIHFHVPRDNLVTKREYVRARAPTRPHPWLPSPAGKPRLRRGTVLFAGRHYRQFLPEMDMIMQIFSFKTIKSVKLLFIAIKDHIFKLISISKIFSEPRLHVRTYKS